MSEQTARDYYTGMTLQDKCAWLTPAQREGVHEYIDEWLEEIVDRMERAERGEQP